MHSNNYPWEFTPDPKNPAVASLAYPSSDGLLFRIDDARLIAAAPELLAVLVGIERSMGWLADNPDEPLIMSRSDFDAVRAAIRKATGE